jgi:rhodanese-related sulfurtransferase
MKESNKISAESFSRTYQDNQNLVLIDVRSPVEFESKHIKGSFNIPIDDLSVNSMKELIKRKKIKTNEEIYFICKSGMRAKLAQQKMEDSKHPIVCVDKGLDGIDSGEGIEYNYGSRGGISLERQVRITIGFLMLAGILAGAFIHPLAYGFSGLISLGFLISGITDWCGMALLIAKMPWNKVATC